MEYIHGHPDREAYTPPHTMSKRTIFALVTIALAVALAGGAFRSSYVREHRG